MVEFGQNLIRTHHQRKAVQLAPGGPGERVELVSGHSADRKTEGVTTEEVFSVYRCSGDVYPAEELTHARKYDYGFPFHHKTSHVVTFLLLVFDFY